jgi:hypothetical protein
VERGILSGRMKLLNRRRPSLAFDDHLTYFTLVEANEFRRLVERSFAAAGHDVSVYGDRIEDRDGTTLGLWNIGHLCAGAEPDEWPELIAEHVALVTAPPRGLDELTTEEVEEALFLRLADAASLPDPDGLAHARVVAPGLLEVLSVDLGDAVVTPSREELEARGTLGDQLARGRANLLSLLAADDPQAVVVGEGTKGRFTSVTDASFFTASLVLALPETVRRFSGEEHGGRGTLVAVPGRHRLLFRPVDAPGAGDALPRMFDVARAEYRDAPGPLSPNVFWVRNNRWVPVTSVDRGKPRLVPGELRDALKSF